MAFLPKWQEWGLHAIELICSAPTELIPSLNEFLPCQLSAASWLSDCRSLLVYEKTRITAYKIFAGALNAAVSLIWPVFNSDILQIKGPDLSVTFR